MEHVTTWLILTGELPTEHIGAIVEFALSGQLSILGVVRAQTFLFDLSLWPFLVFFTNPDVPHPGQIKKTPPAWAK